MKEKMEDCELGFVSLKLMFIYQSGVTKVKGRPINLVLSAENGNLKVSGMLLAKRATGTNEIHKGEYVDSKTFETPGLREGNKLESNLDTLVT